MIETRETIYTSTRKEDFNETERLFKNRIEEYLNIFSGGTRHVSSPNHILHRSISLAKEQSNISEEEISCYYITNFIKNRTLIKEEVLNSSGEEFRQFKLLDILLERDQSNCLFEAMRYLSVDENLKTFAEKYYVKMQIEQEHYKEPLTITDEKKIYTLQTYIDQKKKAISKKH